MYSMMISSTAVKLTNRVDDCIENTVLDKELLGNPEKDNYLEFSKLHSKMKNWTRLSIPLDAILQLASFRRWRAMQY